MSNAKNQPNVKALDQIIAASGLGCSTVTLMTAIPFAVIVGIILFAYQRNQPVETNVVENTSTNSFELETTNPSNVSRRVTEVRFYYKEKLSPEGIKTSIATEMIVFEQSDYDSSTKTFRKILNGVEMPAEGNLNFQFFVRHPALENYRLRGTLQVFYGDRQLPESFSYNDYEMLCIR